MSDNKDNLKALRHSAEHVMHQAVKELFPEVQLAMGPATDEGFYNDFDSSPEGREPVSVTEADFPKIEQRMQEIIDLDLPITKHELSEAEARKLFVNNPYKLEWLEEIVSKGDKITIYWTGKAGEKNSMADLCRGPHVESTGQIKAFKLLSLAGAYWHGDEKNKMLTRIYGTAFSSQKELDDYLHLIEEAKKRDHKKIGQALDLFTFSELVGAGLPLWTPKGTALRNVLNDYVWQLRQAQGYEQVSIPHITKKDLYEKSGHWQKFASDLFRITTREGHEFAMKPMNCPHHTQIFAHLQRSFRDLPQRYAETTMVYRDEQTGELNGLSRVRCITQDDAHVFCRESQLKHEVFVIWDIVEQFYKACGFPKLSVRLSLSDPATQENYLGSKEQWQGWEEQLRQFAKERGVKVMEAKGEAAFYGPKIDFITQDSLGREWQVATIQADRNMPERFDLFCINEENSQERVVMVHAAIMGSIERFISILLEHYAGKLPVWLSPVQVKVLPITDAQKEYAWEITNKLKAMKIRTEVDERSERLQAKIRDAQLQQVPYMLIIGKKEQAENKLAVRSRDSGDLGLKTIEELNHLLKQ